MLRYSRRFGEGSPALANWPAGSTSKTPSRPCKPLAALSDATTCFACSLKGEHDHALERLVLDGQGELMPTAIATT